MLPFAVHTSVTFPAFYNTLASHANLALIMVRSSFKKIFFHLDVVHYGLSTGSVLSLYCLDLLRFEIVQ